MPVLSEHFKELSRQVNTAPGIVGFGGTFTTIETDDLHSLREWWYTILRNYGKYPCYAIFLALPSDQEVIRYIQDSRTELSVISGSDCLIIVLGTNFFFTIGLANPNRLPDDFMVTAFLRQWTSGESIELAKLFHIEATQFPCMVLFTDIRSKEIAVVSFKDMPAAKISRAMRELFTDIHHWAKDDPGNIIESLRKHALLKKASVKAQQAIEVSTALIKKTIEMVIEAWVKSLIP
jgi:hypothetical protein